MLAQQIEKHARVEAAAGDWAAVAQILSANTVPVRNSHPWTLGDLIALIGVESAALVAGSVQAAAAANPILAGAWLGINTTGITLGAPERQAMIDAMSIAGQWPADVTLAVKSAGVTYTSLAGRTVTADECRVAALRASLRARLDALLNQIGTDEQSLATTALRAMADELEG